MARKGEESGVVGHCVQHMGKEEGRACRRAHPNIDGLDAGKSRVDGLERLSTSSGVGLRHPTIKDLRPHAAARCGPLAKNDRARPLAFPGN